MSYGGIVERNSRHRSGDGVLWQTGLCTSRSVWTCDCVWAGGPGQPLLSPKHGRQSRGEGL